MPPCAGSIAPTVFSRSSVPLRPPSLADMTPLHPRPNRLPSPSSHRTGNAWHALAAMACLGMCTANADVTTADVTLGAHVSGPRLEPQALVGRVVMLEFWGIHCPACIAGMPAVEALHRAQPKRR